MAGADFKSVDRSLPAGDYLPFLLEMPVRSLRHWHKARPKPRRYRRRQTAEMQAHSRRWSRGARRATVALGRTPGRACLLGNPLHPATKSRSVFRAHARGMTALTQIGKVFLCVSCAAGSCRGCRGRADSRRKPRRRSIAPTLRSAKITLNRALITRLDPLGASAPHHLRQGLVLCEPALLRPPPAPD